MSPSYTITLGFPVNPSVRCDLHQIGREISNIAYNSRGWDNSIRRLSTDHPFNFTHSKVVRCALLHHPFVLQRACNSFGKRAY